MTDQHGRPKHVPVWTPDCPLNSTDVESRWKLLLWRQFWKRKGVEEKKVRCVGTGSDKKEKWLVFSRESRRQVSIRSNFIHFLVPGGSEDQRMVSIWERMDRTWGFIGPSTLAEAGFGVPLTYSKILFPIFHRLKVCSKGPGWLQICAQWHIPHPMVLFLGMRGPMSEPWSCRNAWML